MSTYLIAIDGKSITCLRCFKTSYSLGDVQNRYCGHCKIFHDDTDPRGRDTMEKETYLGDGCYVSFDGWQLRLRAPREGGDHIIYLEPSLLRNLIEYARTIGMVKTNPQ